MLAFDFGTRRIGVAVGQTMTGSATAVGTLPARNGAPDWSAVDTTDEYIYFQAVTQDNGGDLWMTTRTKLRGPR